ncbi:hypothetical protein AAHH88_00535 [Candidatus Hodgkinia cicadicola]
MPKHIRWATSKILSLWPKQTLALRDNFVDCVVDLDQEGVNLYLRSGELNSLQLKALIRLATVKACVLLRLSKKAWEASFQKLFVD